MARKIIITADDYGAIDSIDDGIIDAINNGPVRSVAAFANSPTAVERLTKLKENTPDDVEIGCHLTLTSGKPVLPIEQIPSVYDEDNNEFFRDFGDFTYSMDEGEVEAELRAQMSVFAEADIKIAHLTAHHNSLDNFEKYHRLSLKLAHEFYPGEIIPTRSAAVVPKVKGLAFREILKVKMEGENTDEELDLFSNFGNRITSDRKVRKVVKEYGYSNARIPVCINSVMYGFPDKKKKSLNAIERKVPKRKKKFLKDISKLPGRAIPYEYVVHLIADDYARYDEFVQQLQTQDYASGVDDAYFDGRMIEEKAIKSITLDDLAEAGAERSSWSSIK